MLDINDIDPSQRETFLELRGYLDEVTRKLEDKLGDNKDKPLEEMNKGELDLKLQATLLEYLCCGLTYPLWEVVLGTSPESVRILQDCIEKNKPLEELHPEVFPKNYDGVDY